MVSQVEGKASACPQSQQMPSCCEVGVSIYLAILFESTLMFIKALLGVAAFTSGINLVVALALHQPVAVLQTYILELVALSVTPFLTYFNHTRTRTSSTILLLFWPLYVAILTIWSRTVIAMGLSNLSIVFALKWVVTGLGLIAFALECLGPEYRSEVSEEEAGKETLEHPLAVANIFSKWSFSWMTPLMKKGVAQFITENDLPPLLEKDESANLGKALRAAMDTQ